MLVPGTRLGPYEVTAQIGVGGPASVRHCREAQQAAGAPPRQTVRGWMVGGALATVGFAAAVALGLTWRTAPPTQQMPVRSLVSVAPAEHLSGANAFEQQSSVRRPSRVALALSPDGTTLVFSAGAQGKQQLYRRPLDQLTATPLPGTESAEHPFFSPDGQWVAFWANGQIQKLPLGGGPAVTICKSGPLFGASWGPDGTIVFAGGRNVGLSRVSAAGGVPTRLTSLKDGEYSHRLPHVTPDGRGVVFTIQRAPTGWEDSRVVIRSLATDDQHVLVEGGADGQVLSTGHLVYARLGTLMAAAFDAERQAVSGDPVGVVDDVMQAANGGHFLVDTGAVQVAFAAVGTMAYALGGIFPDEATEVVIRNRSGERTVVPLQTRRYSLARYSPDASRVVLTTTGGASGALSRQLWVLDPGRGTVSPVSTDAASSYAIWSPDGKELAYRANVGSVDNLFRKDLSSGAVERLTTSSRNETPISWTADGKTIFYTVENDVGGAATDIWAISLPDKSTRAVLATKANETTPEISPDGRWLLYTSNASGREDVYVRPFPGPGEPVQVSASGGKYPLWARSGREIIYFEEPVDGTDVPQLWAVPVSLEPALSLGQRNALFKTSVRLAGPSRAWDLSPDGHSIISTDSPPQAADANAATIVLVQHWFDELRQRVPSSVAR